MSAGGSGKLLLRKTKEILVACQDSRVRFSHSHLTAPAGYETEDTKGRADKPASYSYEIWGRGLHGPKF
jgi:hypothetical protein